MPFFNRKRWLKKGIMEMNVLVQHGIALGRSVYHYFRHFLRYGVSNCRHFRNILHKKMKFYVQNFLSKCDQIRRKQGIWLHLPEKSLMESMIFCAMSLATFTKSLMENMIFCSMLLATFAQSQLLLRSFPQETSIPSGVSLSKLLSQNQNRMTLHKFK